MPGDPALKRRWAFLLSLLAYGALALGTLPGYGVLWDAVELYTGDRQVEFYLTGDTAYLDPYADLPMRLYQTPGHPDYYAISLSNPENVAMVKPDHIWPVGPAATSATALLLYKWLGLMGAIDARHASVVLWGLLLLAVLGPFVRQRMGTVAAVVALAAVMANPRWWSHLHYNFKDVPTAVLFALTAFAFYRGAMRDRWGWLLVSAALWGLGMATKANLAFLAVVLVPWYGWLRWTRWRDGGRFWPRRAVLLSLLAYPLVGFVVMLAAWPWLALEFPRNFLIYVESLQERASSDRDYWTLDPWLRLAVMTPPGLLLLAGVGLVDAARYAWRRRRPRALDLLVVLWLLVTLGRLSMPGIRDFDGIRHWLEIVPGLALLAGRGGQAIWLPFARRWQRRERRALGWRGPGVAVLLVLLAFGWPVVWTVRNHPNEVAYFNLLIGGLPGANARYFGEPTDYWGISYRQGLGWLSEHAAPGSLIIVGNADQTIAFVQAFWIRDDLIPISAIDQTPQRMAATIAAHPGDVYLMYTTRIEHYSDFVRAVDERFTPVYAVTVEGVPLMKIQQLKPLPE